MSNPFVQSYTYDSLNRLQSAEEKSNNISQWKQTFTFDRYGNRRFDTTNNNTTTLPSGYDPNVFNPTFNTANNRMSDNQGYEYDSAGNVTKDATDKRFVYDAENKQTSFGTNGSNTNGGTYFYDGDGKRIKKIVGSETTIFVYNASGQLVAEYAATTPTAPQISYLTSDTLGTPRINTDASGQVTARHDYMPFGEEIIGLGNRQSTNGYQTDNIRQKFTQKERDAETGFNYFGARYYSNAFGRFMSVDPIKLTFVRLHDPQRINLYGYCRQNPLKYFDPDGEDVVPANAQSAAQLKADLDKNLTANEAANIKVTAGQNITIINPNAIDISKASPAYAYLLDVIKPGKTYNYNAVSQGDTIKTSDGISLTWDDVRGGATIPIDTNSLKTATVIDIFVPTTDAPDVLGQNGGFVSFPRDLVSLHELAGHGRCGPGQCGVDVENELRAKRGLPLRSGADHESLPGERPGNQGSTQQNINVPGSPELLTTTPIPINTGPLPMKPIQPLPPPPPKKPLLD